MNLQIYDTIFATLDVIDNELSNKIEKNIEKIDNQF